ncbi:hypothetical protein D6T64_12035 [Cryobacterium melibiosiphilum]|uniref:Uncharacterized protein n=1 Tax=Cryobacterium melibiosiphilum TaxID=995039 RepID=A0A3A5MFC0_9MICO|nr:hypothetical protein [Cryobacterium melibiosiphilum]RJT88112.1 hypothetical protein D6T64_12035 [Cryobacterium melibiosiphilum]
MTDEELAAKVAADTDSRRATELMMKVIDEAASPVAVMTGIKNQYVNAGWSNLGAEAMVLEMFTQSGRQVKK